MSSLRVGYYKYFQLLFDVVEQVGKTGNKDKVGKRSTNIEGGGGFKPSLVPDAALCIDKGYQTQLENSLIPSVTCKLTHGSVVAD